MCGFVGFVDPKKLFNNFETINQIKLMSKKVFHRGPDDNKFWVDGQINIGLGFQRLSIQDLSSQGSQPIESICKRYVLVFNGEIYNFRVLKIKLIKKGHKFFSNSDTEVLLNLILEYGIDDALKQLNGMFAFALWDKQNRKLSLVRDRIGEKPLYYGWQNNIFLFGSELKALKVHKSFLSKINKKAVNLQQKFGSIPSPLSIYENIFKLRPGEILSLNVQNKVKSICKVKFYWSLKRQLTKKYSRSYKNSVSSVEEILSNTIKDQLISDVPLGAFLSGGIDSSLIVALMKKYSNEKINTFTIGFEEKLFNESTYAKKIASYLNTYHSEFYVKPKDMLDVIPELSHIYDEPFSDVSQIPTVILSRLAKKKVTVALTGDGGDEIFGGYNRYKMGRFIFKNIMNSRLPFSDMLNCMIEFCPKVTHKMFEKILKIPEFGLKLEKISKLMYSKDLTDFYENSISQFSNNDNIMLDSNLNNSANLLNLDIMPNLSFEEQLMFWDLINYLPNNILVKVDRASMSTSLETRAPFLDHKLVEYVSKLPPDLKIRKGNSKYLLKQILFKHIPKTYFERPKAGFSVPLDEWLKGPLKNWAEDLLDENKIKQQGYFDHKKIKKLWDYYQKGKKYSAHQFWNILMFQSWLHEQKIF